jgi:hypothetical protein
MVADFSGPLPDRWDEQPQHLVSVLYIAHRQVYGSKNQKHPVDKEREQAIFRSLMFTGRPTLKLPVLTRWFLVVEAVGQLLKAWSALMARCQYQQELGKLSDAWQHLQAALQDPAKLSEAYFLEAASRHLYERAFNFSTGQDKEPRLQQQLDQQQVDRGNSNHNNGGIEGGSRAGRMVCLQPGFTSHLMLDHSLAWLREALKLGSVKGLVSALKLDDSSPSAFAVPRISVSAPGHSQAAAAPNSSVTTSSQSATAAAIAAATAAAAPLPPPAAAAAVATPTAGQATTSTHTPPSAPALPITVLSSPASVAAEAAAALAEGRPLAFDLQDTAVKEQLSRLAAAVHVGGERMFKWLVRWFRLPHMLCCLPTTDGPHVIRAVLKEVCGIDVLAKHIAGPLYFAALQSARTSHPLPCSLKLLALTSEMMFLQEEAAMAGAPKVLVAAAEMAVQAVAAAASSETADHGEAELIITAWREFMPQSDAAPLCTVPSLQQIAAEQLIKQQKQGKSITYLQSDTTSTADPHPETWGVTGMFTKPLAASPLCAELLAFALQGTPYAVHELPSGNNEMAGGGEIFSNAQMAPLLPHCLPELHRWLLVFVYSLCISQQQVDAILSRLGSSTNPSATIEGKGAVVTTRLHAMDLLGSRSTQQVLSSDEQRAKLFK